MTGFVGTAKSVSRPLSGCRVLLAEDAADKLMLYATVLTRAGADVIPTPDGPTAVAAWEGCRRNASRVDAAVLDFDLPGLRGDQVAAELRAAEFRAAIVGYTALERSEVHDLFAAAGCDVMVPNGAGASEFASLVVTACGRQWAE